MTAHNRVSRKERAKQMLYLYDAGFTIEIITDVLNVSQDTLRKYLKEFYNKSIPRETQKKKQPLLCDVCNGRPTQRDNGRLTPMACKESQIKWLCCNCLNP